MQTWHDLGVRHEAKSVDTPTHAGRWEDSEAPAVSGPNNVQ